MFEIERMKYTKKVYICMYIYVYNITIIARVPMTIIKIFLFFLFIYMYNLFERGVFYILLNYFLYCTRSDRSLLKILFSFVFLFILSDNK